MNESKPLILSMLDLSTAHLQLLTADMLHGITHRHPSCLKLSKEQGWPVAYSKEEFGYFIHVDEEQSWKDDDSELPEDLKAILRYAFSLGCAWINLDRDGEVMNGVLPVYEW